MHCPDCRRPLVKTFVRAVYAPSEHGHADKCGHCRRAVAVSLPSYLSAREYVTLGGAVAGFALALLLGLDAPVALRIQFVVSAFALFAGLVALLTWTQAEVK